ncbi:MAG: NYN domain-containing protein [Bdellovibrionales bacterium]|nr:NYN domain-containing protein [Bdellovibrionales bacterium]
MEKTQAAKKLCFQKVGIFVDAENIELSGLKHFEGYTNYKKILDQVGDREVIRILYYKPEYKEISAEFMAFWKGLGGEIRRPAKNADTFLVIDAVTMADKLDVAIILGGDKDFLPLIWYLKSRGCRTEIWSWPQATSQVVKEAVDQYFPLDESFVLGSDDKKTAPKKPHQSRNPRGNKDSQRG